MRKQSQSGIGYTRILAASRNVSVSKTMPSDKSPGASWVSLFVPTHHTNQSPFNLKLWLGFYSLPIGDNNSRPLLYVTKMDRKGH